MNPLMKIFLPSMPSRGRHDLAGLGGIGLQIRVGNPLVSLGTRQVIVRQQRGPRMHEQQATARSPRGPAPRRSVRRVRRTFTSAYSASGMPITGSATSIQSSTARDDKQPDDQAGHGRGAQGRYCS